MTGNHESCRSSLAIGALLLTGLIASFSAHSDEGGVSFWLPGQYASFSAVPAEKGWSLGTVYYYASADADASHEFSIGGSVVAGLDSQADLIFLAPNYAFDDPVWGGQLSLSVTGVVGRADVEVDAVLTGPGGNEISFSESDSDTGIGDLYPTATIRWNKGNNNYMTYLMGGVPVGDYNVNDLANLGTNHWSADMGGGYTYLNEKSGREFSAVLGFTYNFENHATDYQNGIDAHLDWAASQFLSETMHVGLVGYIYRQISGDSGSGAKLGPFKSRVVGIGPEAGWFFKDQTIYFNVRGYWEFDAKNRPDGWNFWLTLSVPLGKGES
jgi:hypothetical protein